MSEGVTQLLINWRNGDKAALDQLMPLVYEELRRLARRFMEKERCDHTLETSALINEAYTSEQGGERTLWRVHIEGGESVQLTNNPAEWPDISPDGKLIACWYREINSGKWKLAILPFDGGTPIKLFDDLSGPSRSIRWMPGGSAITYVVTRNEISNLWSQPLNEPAPKQLTDFKSELIYNFDWSRDAKLICSRGYTARNIMLISESQ